MEALLRQYVSAEDSCFYIRTQAYYIKYILNIISNIPRKYICAMIVLLQHSTVKWNK